ncbi:hypothetical protein SAMN02745857_02755 [Andreprevotia lacus DSM 23236]|uniref:Uncharacterized protein n=1 Tax=Andreprevotia lacus DSM 23236 TaxID=1121001 RepID=A0A1W1XTJ7_9NEIS|nr:hypothetical protein [Andreprevotia lacus]SMC27217.1 hypothetical protein SAMN02745857_02755 [Andreprevotia lacus DSM 23236]
MSRYFDWTYNYLPGAIVGSYEATQLLAATRRGFELTEADYQTTLQSFATRAPLDSPQLSGTPRGPHAQAGDNSTQLATTGWVVQAVNLQGIAASDQLAWARQMRRARLAFWNLL